MKFHLSLLALLLSSSCLWAQSSFLSSWKPTGVALSAHVVGDRISDRLFNNYTFSEFQGRVKDPEALPENLNQKNGSLFLAGNPAASYIAKGTLILTKTNAEKDKPTFTQHLIPGLSLGQNTIGEYGSIIEKDVAPDSIIREGWSYSDVAVRAGISLGYQFQYNPGRRWFFFAAAKLQSDFSVSSKIREVNQVGERIAIGSNLNAGAPWYESTRKLDAKNTYSYGGALSGGLGANLSDIISVFLSMDQGIYMQATPGDEKLRKELFHLGGGLIHKL